MSKIEEIRELCDIRDADDLDLELPTATVRELIALIQNGQSAIDTNKRLVCEISRLQAELENYKAAEQDGRLAIAPPAESGDGWIVWDDGEIKAVDWYTVPFQGKFVLAKDKSFKWHWNGAPIYSTEQESAALREQRNG